MKEYKLGLVLGRFQGVHIGHESIINRALELCSDVLILIGSANKKNTKENPFPVELRYQMLSDIFNDKRVHIFPLDDLGVGNVPSWGDYVIENAIKDFGKPDLIIQGIEVKTNTWYKNFQDIHFLEVDREIVPINATKLRGYILEDNKDEFFKYTNPKIHKYYEELRKYLLEVWHA
jgi:nicotinamide-nucleotide adenylyltransferase